MIVGTANNGPGWYKAVRWTPVEGLTALVDAGTGQDVFGDAYGVSADGSVIVGVSLSEPFRWTADDGPVVLGDLSGGHSGGRAHAVSADGTVVTGVSSSQSGYGSEAFRWKNGVMTGLGDLPGGAFWSNARDVSGNGLVIVGGAYSAAHSREAFRCT